MKMVASLRERLDSIEDLPTVPHTMQQVLSELDSISASAATLQSIIEQDPAITAKILKMANSPFYGTVVDISNVGRAMVTMGFDEVRNVVIGISLAGVFCDDLGFDEFQTADLWLHSIGVATAARHIAEEAGGLDPDDLFTAGMLHDLGRLLYCIYFKEEVNEILAEKKNSGCTLLEAEERIGLNHAEIGAYLARRWDLSDFLFNVIRFHHNYRAAGEYEKAAAAIFLADGMAKSLKIGWSGLDGPEKIVIPKALGFSNDKAKSIALKIKDERTKIIDGWGMIIS